ncbi:uncharacterized protein LOC115100556 [Rhinatrema bivittatum]|uniref:uncharacterized protein LOC115100556 n=1 Tax=Rhinatrema bivittatum TaxID=194408 RepID=UPI00112A17AB|nr:uncharacterized protein LOC115100556 [Rhinatrema bivittatum]
MGQVLGFAHCKEAPSTASSTPDSTPSATDAANDESDFPELQTAREFSEDEEETSQDWGTPRELTFSYITFASSDGGSLGSSPDPAGCGLRPKRDSSTRELDGSGRFRKSKLEISETFLSGLADSLENIPSLSQSPETEHQIQTVRAPGPSDPLFGWDTDISYMDATELAGDRVEGHESHRGESGRASLPHGVQARRGAAGPRASDLPGDVDSMDVKGRDTAAVKGKELISRGSFSSVTCTGGKRRAVAWDALPPEAFLQHAGAATPSPVGHAAQRWRPPPTSVPEDEGDQADTALYRGETDHSGIALGICIHEKAHTMREEQSKGEAVLTCHYFVLRAMTQEADRNLMKRSLGVGCWRGT